MCSNEAEGDGGDVVLEGAISVEAVLRSNSRAVREIRFSRVPRAESDPFQCCPSGDPRKIVAFYRTVLGFQGRVFRIPPRRKEVSHPFSPRI